MRLDRVELWRLDMPLVSPFRTSYGIEKSREVLLLRAYDDQGCHGWGECVAPAAPGYSAEYAEAAELCLRRFLVPIALSLSDLRPSTLLEAFEQIKGHRMAKAALEMAVIDVFLRSRSMSLADYLGSTRKKVDAGVAVGVQGSLEELVELVAGYVEAGYRRVKLKIMPGWDLEPLAAVRRTFGADLALAVDANGAYRLADARHLAQLDGFHLDFVEQPLAEEATEDHVRLAQVMQTPICLDEPVVSARAAESALSSGACSVINIKPARLGGLLEAKRVQEVAQALGASAWCGGMLESGVGRAACLAVAALPGCNMTGDLSASSRYFERDVTPPFVLEDGCLRVPEGPGIGVEVEPSALEELARGCSVLNAAQ